MMNFQAIIGIALLATMQAPLGASGPSAPGSSPISSISSDRFALGTHKVILQSKQDESNTNSIYSPLSLSSSLSMLLYGARGETANQISKLLLHKATYDASGDVKQLAKDFQRLYNAAIKPNEKVMAFANFVYARRGVRITADYQDTLRRYFGTDQVKQLNFGTQQAVDTINNDVKRTTRGEIDKLFDDLDPLTASVVVNAVYFKGYWKHPFDPKKTAKGIFHAQNGEQTQVDMMSQTADILYAKNQEKHYDAVLLPYSDSDVSMIILLPHQGTTLMDLEAEGVINEQTIGEILIRLKEREVKLEMPKYRIESEHDLKPVLQKLGIIDMFQEGRADFSGMLDGGAQGFKVSEIIQKAMIQVDEQGTKAAAATGVKVVSYSMPMTIPFRCDRPFAFFIVAHLNGMPEKKKRVNPKIEDHVILFMGSVKNPN